MLSKDNLCEWWMTLVKFTAIYFAVLPFPFFLEWWFLFSHASPFPSSWQWEITWQGAFRNSLKFPQIQESSSFNHVNGCVCVCVCVWEREREREKERESYKKRTGSTGQLPWRQTSVKRYLCRNSPRFGEIFQDKANPLPCLSFVEQT